MEAVCIAGVTHTAFAFKEESNIKILVVEPMKKPYEKEITGDLREMQDIMGGTIQAVYPFQDMAAIVCNDDGKRIGLPPNRFLRDGSGEPYDVLCGTFFVVGVGREDFVSLTAFCGLGRPLMRLSAAARRSKTAGGNYELFRRFTTTV